MQNIIYPDLADIFLPLFTSYFGTRDSSASRLLEAVVSLKVEKFFFFPRNFASLKKQSEDQEVVEDDRFSFISERHLNLAKLALSQQTFSGFSGYSSLVSVSQRTRKH